MAELAGLAASVDDGDIVAVAGKTLHRTPSAFVRELVRQDVRDVTVLGVANSLDVDLLCGAGLVNGVHFGYVGFEGLGLAPNFRRAVEAGRVTAREGTCYTVAAMLRGAAQNAPFMPVSGIEGSDLVKVNPVFGSIDDPFTGEEEAVVRTVRPDVGVVHATAADERGNARFTGADLTESLVASAAERTFVTAERLVETATFQADPGRTQIPEVLVDGVAEVPGGAHPCSSPGEYAYDREHLAVYLEYARADRFDEYLTEYLGPDEAAYRERVAFEGSIANSSVPEGSRS